MTTPDAATDMTQVLVLHDREGNYYRISRAVLEASRVPADETASLEAAMRDDTGGFFFYDFIKLAMPSPAVNPRANEEPIKTQRDSTGANL